MFRKPNVLPKQHLRALVLDADPAALHDLRRLLEARSFSVVSAGEGTCALALLLDELLDLDVLVLDADLPQRDARSFVDLIRRAGGERDLAIVVVAQVASEAFRRELRALGADAVVDRTAGPTAAAAAVHSAVAARLLSSGHASERAAPVDPAPPAPAAPWALSHRQWSLLPA